MAKDDRIVVRMSSELKDWVHAQAASREMDDAAYVRMVLAEARSGVAATRIKAEVPLDVAGYGRGPMMDAVTLLKEDHARPIEEHNADVAASIDIDAMVAATVAEAEEAGLTQSQIEEAQGDMPHAGVRPLMRRPIPFSRGTQSARLEQMFGGNN